MGVGAAEPSVVQVEDGFMGGAAALVVGVTALAVIDVEPGGCVGVLDEAAVHASESGPRQSACSLEVTGDATVS